MIIWTLCPIDRGSADLLPFVIGNSCRMREYMLPSHFELQFWEPREKFCRGGKAYRTFMKMIMEDTGLTREELIMLAKDRDQWSQLRSHL